MRRQSEKPAPRLHYCDFAEMNCGEDAYLAHPALGSTALKGFLDPSPTPAKEDDLRDGTAWHWLVFQRDVHGWRVIQEDDFGSLQSSTNRATRKRWITAKRAEGLFPLPPDSFRAVHKMAEAALAIPECRAVIEHPKVRLEQAQTYRCKEFPGLELRRKPDGDVPGWILADGKSTKERTLEGYEKAICKLGYDLQGALYKDSGEAYYRDVYENGFWHIVACKVPDRNGDHQAAVLQIHPDTIERGRRLVLSAVMLADAARISGRPTPYLLNARPRVTRPPQRWERQQADALLAHAQETYRQCTNMST
jgi:hypothetical protein